MIGATTAWGSAVGSGITGPYAIPFSLYSQAHLTVLLFSSDTVTTQVLGTNYTFTSFVQDTKGQCASPQITFTNAVANGVLIVFLLAPPDTQLLSISNYAQYAPIVLEQAYDLLTQSVLQLREWAGKTAKAPDQEQSGATSQTMPSKADRSSKGAGWDVNGNLVAIVSVPTGSVSFSTLGTAIAGIANLTSLLSTLGIFLPANAGALAALTPISNSLNLAFQLDTNQLFLYNFSSATWNKVTTGGP